MALGFQRSGSPLGSYLRIPMLMTGSPLTHLKKESPPVNTHTHDFFYSLNFNYDA